MPYDYITLAQLRAKLLERMQDSGAVMTPAAEADIYIREALRVLNAITLQPGTVDYVFDFNAGDTWKSLNVAGSPRERTITDSDIYMQIEAMLMEPMSGGTWTGTDQYNLAMISGALQYRRDELLLLSASNVVNLTQPSPLASMRTFLPDSTLNLHRVRWVQADSTQGTPYALGREDIISRNADGVNLSIQPGEPDSWMITANSPLSFDCSCPPNQPGTWDMLISFSGTLTPPVGPYEFDTFLNSPSNGGSGTSSDTLYAPYAISMVGTSVPGDTFSGFSVVQPEARLFLSFYTSSLALISTIDLSIVGSTVTSPASTAFFMVSANNAVAGHSYDTSFALNSQGISYSVIPHGALFETDFDSANVSPSPGTNVWPLAPANSGYVVNFPFAPTGNLNLIFYSVSLAVLQTNTVAVGSFTAPANTSFWSVAPGTLAAGSNSVAEYTFDPPADSLVGIPDDWTPALVYGVLADVLANAPEGRDSARAKYCLSRYEQFKKAIVKMPWLLKAQVGQVSVDTPGFKGMDTQCQNWEVNAPEPVIVVGGVDLIALGPFVTGDTVSTVLTVVGNAPVPVVDSDPIQLSRDGVDALLAYSQHVTTFKLGGRNFAVTMPLYEQFEAYCRLKNSQYNALGLFRPDMIYEGNRQDVDDPRFQVESEK